MQYECNQRSDRCLLLFQAGADETDYDSVIDDLLDMPGLLQLYEMASSLCDDNTSAQGADDVTTLCIEDSVSTQRMEDGTPCQLNDCVTPMLDTDYMNQQRSGVQTATDDAISLQLADSTGNIGSSHVEREQLRAEPQLPAQPPLPAQPQLPAQPPLPAQPQLPAQPPLPAQPQLPAEPQLPNLTESQSTPELQPASGSPSDGSKLEPIVILDDSDVEKETTPWDKTLQACEEYRYLLRRHNVHVHVHLHGIRLYSRRAIGRRT